MLDEKSRMSLHRRTMRLNGSTFVFLAYLFFQNWTLFIVFELT